MPLVFAALSPHTPILIPSIGKENINKLDNTVKALNLLEKELYSHLPEVLLVIAPQATQFSDGFTLDIGSANNNYNANFKQFGEFSTEYSFKHEAKLASLITDNLMDEFPITMVSNEILDHSISVPLSYLTSHLPNISIITLSVSNLDQKTHYNLGKKICDILNEYPKRVAVIGSLNLSHTLSKDAPAGFNEKGVEADQKIQEILERHEFKKLLKFDQEIISKAVIKGFDVLTIMSGMLEGLNFHYKKFSYESPFGVGYLVAEFELP